MSATLALQRHREQVPATGLLRLIVLFWSTRKQKQTGVVLGVIAGSSVVLLTVNAVLAELSDRVFAGKGVQDFFGWSGRARRVRFGSGEGRRRESTVFSMLTANVLNEVISMLWATNFGLG